jgi:hypothetical protein
MIAGCLQAIAYILMNVKNGKKFAINARTQNDQFEQKETHQL